MTGIERLLGAAFMMAAMTGCFTAMVFAHYLYLRLFKPDEWRKDRIRVLQDLLSEEDDR